MNANASSLPADRYRRVGVHSYEYEAHELPFVTEIECDHQDVVQTYGGLWRQSS